MLESGGYAGAVQATRDLKTQLALGAAAFSVDLPQFWSTYAHLYSVYEDIEAKRMAIASAASDVDASAVAPQIEGVRAGAFDARHCVSGLSSTGSLTNALMLLRNQLAHTLTAMHAAGKAYENADYEAGNALMGAVSV